VITGGPLHPQKGINLPGLTTNIESLTEKDRQDLVFGLANDVDFVAVSFVQVAADLRSVREFIARTAPDKSETPIIAKLERPAAVENLEELLAVCEGVMVARGDLGVEMAPHRIPAIQKHIIQRANATGRIVITATQMLESMIENPRPTRAEASDVANAIFDGSDAVMLSAETANGAHPVATVRMMRQIIEEAEQHVGEWGHYRDQLTLTTVTPVALARAAAKLAYTLPIAAIVVFTRTGNNTLLLSKERPAVPIIGCTAHERARRRMAIMHGTTPHLLPQAHSLNEMVATAENLLLNEVGLQLGQQVVIIVGLPVEHMRPANIVMVHVLGDKR
jgi:pyruvate kinase